MKIDANRRQTLKDAKKHFSVGHCLLCAFALKRSLMATRVERAFTRLDMAVLIGMAALLLAWFGIGQVGERGRTLHCAWNLAALGKAMHRYANEHDDALPAAGVNVGQYQTSWDLRLLPYRAPGLAKQNNEELARTVSRFFSCPSDKIWHRGSTRSYAMGSNDMTLQNWPPGGDSATGVGLNWDKPAVLRLLNEDALKQPEILPGVKLADIPVPAKTVLLTELIVPNNVIGSYQAASVSGCVQQQQPFPDGGAKFHGGRFNYLMVDGHVELLTPLQTGAFDGTGGIWTLKKGD
jgi:prepilin-type processing-associated H-X9-DG protein